MTAPASRSEAPQERRPVRLRLSRARGFDLQRHSLATNGLGAVNVARPSRWGSMFLRVSLLCSDRWHAPLHQPLWDAVFLHWERGDRAEAYRAIAQRTSVELFRIEVEHFRDVDPAAFAEWIGPLIGRNPACWCAQDEPCHADVLLELANA